MFWEFCILAEDNEYFTKLITEQFLFNTQLHLKQNVYWNRLTEPLLRQPNENEVNILRLPLKFCKQNVWIQMEHRNEQFAPMNN